MTTLSNDDLAVLARRIKLLRKHGYGPDVLNVLERVRDELALRRHTGGQSEQAFVHAVQDNRRLRASLIKIGEALATERATISTEARRTIAHVLDGVKEPGAGRAIFNLELKPTDNPEVIKLQVVKLIDDFFARVTPHRTAADGHGDGGEAEQAPGGVRGVPANEPGTDRAARGDGRAAPTVPPDSEPGSDGGR